MKMPRMREACLPGGIAVLLISNGQLIAPLGAVVSAALLIVFADGERPAARLVVLAPLFLLAHCFIWFHIIPAPGLLYYAAACAYGLAHFLPYVVQRALKASERSFAFTLAFPGAYVGVEALLDRLTPYGSWSSLAYTQSPDSLFGQLAALGGVAFVTFALTWTAAIAAWAWVRRADARAIGGVTLAVALVLTGLSGVSVLRARLLPPPRANVTIAGLLPDRTLRQALERQTRDMHGDPSASLIAASTALNEDLISRTRTAASQGAQIVVWPETAARLLKHDEPSFVAEITSLSHQTGAFIFASYGTLNPGAERPFENRVAVVSPTSGLVATFDKAHPIVGTEANSVRAGPAVLPSVETPFGRIGVIICHDADFPRFVRQARQRQVDLLINPADDWPTIQDLHANMARYRAVENGLTLVRIANGISFVADPTGRIQAQTNSFAGGASSFLFTTAVRRTAAYGGEDAFVVFCALMLCALVIFALTVSLSRRSARR